MIFLLACTGPDQGESTPADTEECPGARSLPDGLTSPLGSWTSTFAQEFYDDTCSADNLDRDSEGWIGSFTLDGNAPEAMYLYFDPDFDANTETFDGVMDERGGVTFTGVHAHKSGTMYAQFGGLLYPDQYLGRDVIDGAAFLGLDTNQDGLIDCGARGSWRAMKSG